MKYFYEKPNTWSREGWKVIQCEHPLFNRGTLLYSEDGRGFIAVQKHFDPVSKSSWWGSLDSWLAYDIRKAERFEAFFEEHANPEHSCVVPVRKLMWELRMKPLRKEYWEEEEF